MERVNAALHRRNQTCFVGWSSMVAPFVRAKPALECGREAAAFPESPSRQDLGGES